MRNNGQETEFEKKFGKALPFVLFILLITGAIIGSILIHMNAKNTANERFMRTSNSVAVTVQNRLRYYENALGQTASMFMASEDVTSDEFQTYTENMGIKNEYPGISAIGYAPILRRSQLRAFVSKQKSQGDSGYKIRPRGSDENLYTPIQHLKKFRNHLKPLLGFNMMNEPSLKFKMLEAGKEGSPIIAESLAIFSQKNAPTRDGFVVFAPVYKRPDKSILVPTLKNLKGYVFGIFNYQVLFTEILKSQNYFQEAIGLKVFLKAPGGRKLIFESASLYGPKTHTPKMKEVAEFEMGGRFWSLDIYTLPLIEGDYETQIGWYVFLLGLMFSILVLLIARRFSKAKQSVEESEVRTSKVARENALLAEAGEKLGTSLSTQTSMELLCDFFTRHFSDICVIDFSEEETFQQVIKVSGNIKTPPELSRLKLKSYAGQFVEEQNLKGKVREKEDTISSSETDSKYFKSFITLPLIIRGRLFGIVTLLCLEESKDKLEESTGLLSHLTRISSVFIENTLLYEKAEMANRLKDEFLATVSHELRTPLNVVYGHAQLLLESDLDPDHRDQINSIYKAAKAQGTIIDDLLDVSSIISGKVNFNPRPIKVVDALDTALESLKLEAKTRGIQLIFDEAHQCIIMGVKTRLVQIFWNLLSNAIKFTPEGGKVAVKTEVEEQKCYIKIIDTGKGIDPEFLPHIFEKFRQEDKVTTRSRGGLGLGLSIVSHLVSLHGGTIKAESEGKNKGSTFTVSFPIVSLTARTGPKEEKEKLEAIERHDLHEISVLAVDDEPESLNLIARILRSYKATVITASNGVEALKKLKSERPDVLISDIAMPEMDGYELIKEIRQKERAQGTHIPAIALTAFAQEEDKQRALSSGYEAYLSKPVNKEKLIGTVEQALH